MFHYLHAFFIMLRLSQLHHCSFASTSKQMEAEFIEAFATAQLHGDTESIAKLERIACKTPFPSGLEIIARV